MSPHCLAFSVGACALGLLTGLLTSVAGAQTPPSVADTSPFRALDLPAPNEYRTGSGRPGPRYWQQRADYRIAATLDPARNELHGRETIHYTNHAPEALSYLWLYLEQNICAPNSVTNLLNQPPLVFLGSSFDFSCQGFSGGLILGFLRRAGRVRRGGVDRPTISVDLAPPPGAKATVDRAMVWLSRGPGQGAGGEW